VRLNPGVAAAEGAISGLALAYNLAVHRALPHATHIPVNLAAAGVFLVLARAAGTSLDDLGLSPGHIPAGLKVGLAASAPIAATVALTASIPTISGFYDDHRVTRTQTRHVLYRALVRTPLGVAVPEETIFRGAVLSLALRDHNPVTAVALNALLFGLWHVLPTIDSLEGNAAGTMVGDHEGKRVGATAGVVLATAVAGAALAGLRLCSGSLLAPVIAHTSLNALALLAGHLRHRLVIAAGEGDVSQ
jgi:uncharacterized protein